MCSLYLLKIINVLWLLLEIGSGESPSIAATCAPDPFSSSTRLSPFDGERFKAKLGDASVQQGAVAGWTFTSWPADAICLQNKFWVEKLHIRIPDSVIEFASLLAWPPSSSKCFRLICRDAQNLRDIPCQTLAVLLIACEILESNYLSLLTTQHISRCLTPQ